MAFLINLLCKPLYGVQQNQLFATRLDLFMHASALRLLLRPPPSFLTSFLCAPPQVTGRLLAAICACILSMHSFALRLLLRISSCNVCISSGPTGANFDKRQSCHLALPCRRHVSRTTPAGNPHRLMSTAYCKRYILLFRCLALFPTTSHRT